MSDKARLTIQVSATRSIIIHGARNGRVIDAQKAVCTEYRGYVLVLGKNGKLYSPSISGIHYAEAHRMMGRTHGLMRGLLDLGVITQAEMDAAVARVQAEDEKRERRIAAFNLREAASALGIKIPATMERKLAA